MNQNEVINKAGRAIDFDSAVNLMDSELREQLYDAGDWANDNQAFFTAYETAHELIFGQEWELSKANPTW